MLTTIKNAKDAKQYNNIRYNWKWPIITEIILTVWHVSFKVYLIHIILYTFVCSTLYHVHVSMITFMDKLSLISEIILYFSFIHRCQHFTWKLFVFLFECISHNYYVTFFNHTAQSPRFPYGTFKMSYYFLFCLVNITIKNFLFQFKKKEKGKWNIVLYMCQGLY